MKPSGSSSTTWKTPKAGNTLEAEASRGMAQRPLLG